MNRIITNLKFNEWLKEYGRVFKVIDYHDSGNISYGVINNELERKFIKFAPSSHNEAVKILYNASIIYDEITHPILTKFNSSIECEDGFALMFNFIDAESINEVVLNKDCKKISSRHSTNSAYNKLKRLPISKLLSVVNKILHLHLTLEKHNYVSCDWYDGCLMYDFNDDKLHIMDIDTYSKGSFINSMGRMYGSRRFMAPEEFELGCKIDSRTMVYHMGATIFELLGTGKDTPDVSFRGNKAQYELALKAISQSKANRYQTVSEMYFDWVETIEHNN